jgi:putative SOS response-associated peptidase YedK
LGYNVVMCGAYGFSIKNAKQVYDRFGIQNTLDLKPRYNIRPGQLNPVVTNDNQTIISLMFWGLIPHFAQNENYKYKTINAKSETVAQLPTFRQPFRHNRCIVPATGFYEPDKKHVAKPPYPWHYFQLKDQPIFGFAGLFDTWVDKDSGKQITSYTIITTTPNKLIAKYHERMSVILQKEAEQTWLNPDNVEPEHLLPLLKPYPPDEMEEWQVTGAARNPKNDYPDLITPLKST